MSLETLPEFLQSPWVWLSAIAGALVAVVGWFEKLSKALASIKAVIKGWLEPSPERDYPNELLASFVDTPDELASVLELRSRVFKQLYGKDVISPDQTYWDAYEKNKHAFSILSEKGIAFGYWGLIPVSEAHYRAFVAGEMTHDQMLSTATLGLEEVDPENLYLYYVGTVSLKRSILQDDEPEIYHMESKVVLDSLAVAYGLSKRFKIKGIVLYASTAKGWKIARKRLLGHGFERSGRRVVESDQLTEIMELKEENMANFFQGIQEQHLNLYTDKPRRGLGKLLGARVRETLEIPEAKPRIPSRDPNQIKNGIRAMKAPPKPAKEEMNS